MFNISDISNEIAVPIYYCSLPKTINGQLLYGCVQTVFDSCRTCSKYACLIASGAWATCIPPGIYHLVFYNRY